MDFRKQFSFHDLKSFEDAEKLAKLAMEQNPGVLAIAYDYGSNVSPRYGIIEPPKVGDDVSRGFNGDYYPVGKVEQIGKNYRMIKAGGEWFRRRKLAPTWTDGTFALVRGIIDERNPSF